MRRSKKRKIRLEHVLLVLAIVMLLGIVVGQFANQAADDYIKEIDKKIEKYEGG